MKNAMQPVLILLVLSKPAFAVDTCLVGLWQMDANDFANAMGAQMGGTASYESGSATLEISEAGAMSLLAQDLAVAAAMPDVPPMTITISGYSRGDITADDGATYVANATDYALVGSADVLGTRMDIPLTTADGAGWGQSSGNYACVDDVLSFVPNEAGSIPPTWRRVR
ncbi:hypothetical protein [Yoonia sp. 2307UL14-13]|uniref:hypothetical protein n=1 Tax=Yoonia sp. 2307UL14-13 TaxID=3126506 RepID=UPI00309D0766